MFPFTEFGAVARTYPIACSGVRQRNFDCFDGCISSSIFLIQSIKICFHSFFNFFRIFCAQHQIRFLIICNSFQPALYMVTEILEIIYLLFLSNLNLTFWLRFTRYLLNWGSTFMSRNSYIILYFTNWFIVWELSS